MLLKDHLAEYISACFTGLWIQSHEHDDALAEIAQMCRDQEWRLAVWDAERGLHLPGQIVRGVEPQTLRDSQGVRQQVATQLSQVETVLDTLLTDRPRRNILRRPK